MSVLTKESDLLHFINQKKQSVIDVSSKKILLMYSKIITSSITRSLGKLGIYKYTISCCESVIQLFWLLFLYSKNLKLTMFLCDRAILLFNEYVIMTKSTLFGNNSLDSVNLSEVKCFVYKKTIGPLFLGELTLDSELPRNFVKACKLLGEIYLHTTIKEFKYPRSKDKHLSQEDDMESLLKEIQKSIIERIHKLSLDADGEIINMVNEFIQSVDFDTLNAIEGANGISILLCAQSINLSAPQGNCSLIKQQQGFNKLCKLCQEQHSKKLLKKDDVIIKEHAVSTIFQ